MTIKVLGIDSASKRSGFALYKDRRLNKLAVFDSNESLSLGGRLIEFQQQVKDFMPCDLVVIEKVSKSRNLNTVRMLAYFEAAAIIEAEKAGAKVAKRARRTKAEGHSARWPVHFSRAALFVD